MKKPTKGHRFKLYNNGPLCEITSVSDDKVRFMILNNTKITGAISRQEFNKYKIIS